MRAPTDPPMAFPAGKDDDAAIDVLRAELVQARQENQSLAQALDRHCLAAEAAGLGIWDCELDSGACHVSPIAQGILGSDPDHCPDAVTAFFNGRTSDDECELQLRDESGRQRWVYLQRRAVLDEMGRPHRYVGSIMDIDSRKRGESALRASEERFALASKGSTDGIFDWDIVSGDMYFSERAQVLHGHKIGPTVRPRTVWRSLTKLHPDDDQVQLDAVANYLSGKTDAYDGEWRVLFPDGSYRWVRMRGVCLRDAEGRPTRMSGSISDIDDRKRAEAALRASEERYALAVAGSSDGLWDWDLLTNELFLSERTQVLYGLSPGQTVRPRPEWRGMIVIHPDDVERQSRQIDDFIAGHGQYDIEFRFLYPDGVFRWIRDRGICVRDADGRATRMVGSTTDIDPRRRAEAALLRSQRLEATGILAGGIAHDFNNILAVIVGYGEMALRDATPTSRLRRELDSIMVAAERGRLLVDLILAFSRTGVGQRVPVQASGVVREVLDLLAETLTGDLQVQSVLTSDAAAVLGDPTQLHQVVMNLATNAVQAMPDGGLLHVSVSIESVDSQRLMTTGPTGPGEFVVLSFKDAGTGIRPDVADRIFDPFFTTKEPGEGTGLGLALVHGIVMDMGGAVNVESTVGEGSTFSVYLPRVGETAACPASTLQLPARGNHQQILVVDDEAALVSLMTETLTELGYVPVGFTSSEDALAAFLAHPERFDAVITDERMPGLTGSSLATQLRKERPTLPIILISGYPGRGVEARARGAGVDDILKKPLRASEIALALARVLTQAATDAAD